MTQTHDYEVKFRISFYAKAAAASALRSKARELREEARKRENISVPPTMLEAADQLEDMALAIELAEADVAFYRWLAEIPDRVWDAELPWRDWYDMGMSAAVAARKAVDNG